MIELKEHLITILIVMIWTPSLQVQGTLFVSRSYRK